MKAPDSNATKLMHLATVGSIVGTSITGAVCALPLTAILLGIGGLGWLTQYSYLRVPASFATLLLLLYGLGRTQRPLKRCPAPAPNSRARVLLCIAALVALIVNLFEYVVLPRLG